MCGNGLTLSQTTNITCFQNEKSLQTTISNLMTIEKSSSNRLKTLWENEKLPVMSNFSFSHSVFKRLVLQTRKKQGLCGKGLRRGVVSEQSSVKVVVHCFSISLFIWFSAGLCLFAQILFLLISRVNAMKLYRYISYDNLKDTQIQIFTFYDRMSCNRKTGLHVKFPFFHKTAYIPKSVLLMCFHQRDILWRRITFQWNNVFTW